MFRNGCVIKKNAQLRKICCPPPLSNLKRENLKSHEGFFSLKFYSLYHTLWIEIFILRLYIFRLYYKQQIRHHNIYMCTEN